MIKLLIISSDFPPMRTPESAHTLHLSRHLAEFADVHVLTTQISGISNEYPFTVHPIMPAWSWHDMPRLIRFLKAFSPDVILLIYLGWIYKFNAMITFAPTLCRWLLPQTTFITQFENTQGAELPTRRSELQHRLMTLLCGYRNVHKRYGTLLRDSHRIIVLSEHHRETLQSCLPDAGNKIDMIPAPPLMQICSEDNGAARERGRALVGASNDEFVVAYFGYVYPTKGIETLIGALESLITLRSSVRLVIVGDAHDENYGRQIQDLIKVKGLSNQVSWMGHLPDAEASLCLRAADLCVLPFDDGVRLNNSSFAVAAGHGLPIISTRGETLEEQFRHTENVWLCPPKDTEALAAAIEALANDKELRVSLSAGALRLAREWFSWQRVTQSTMSSIDAGLLKTRRSARIREMSIDIKEEPVA